LPYVTRAVDAELDSARQFYAKNSRCLFCDLIKQETIAEQRVVLRMSGCIAISAYAPRQPYEMWILPELHQSGYEELSDGALQRQAGVLRELLLRLDKVSPGAAYNLLLHTGPYRASDAAFHWHWELVPRLTHEAGLEWGGGIHITPLSPERAAAELRSADVSV
jgi:UDPglucose--hexose-1-phosphate uridylyltransferase